MPDITAQHMQLPGHLVLSRYERGQRVAYGGALVQRHVALPQDLANKEGKGLLVRPAFQC